MSGQPASASPWALNDSAFRTKTADFPRHLTLELFQALDEHAHAFLAAQGIDDEPIVWHPPKGLLDGLDLPGPDPDAINPTELHRVMAVHGIKLGTAAHRLSTSLDAVRYLLETHPAPLPVPVPGTRVATSHNRAYCTARSALSRDRLADLYEAQRMSLRESPPRSVSAAKQSLTSPTTMTCRSANPACMHARRSTGTGSTTNTSTNAAPFPT